jgi:hypothetical protein
MKNIKHFNLKNIRSGSRTMDEPVLQLMNKNCGGFVLDDQEYAGNQFGEFQESLIVDSAP